MVAPPHRRHLRISGDDALMATLALAAAGAAVGNALLPAGVSVLGATLSGATIGTQIGALAGSFIDRALFAPSGQTRSVEGPRLASLHVTASTEGAPIPRIYGRVRSGGQIVWATDFEEQVVTTTTEVGGGGGGKGGGGGGGGATTETTEYRYYANFAVALCEGEIGGVGRMWADGHELDLGQYVHRVYPGSETQAPDSLIAAREGAGNAPAYRGVAYIVFERMPLAEFGNRVPQLSFEVLRPVDDFNDEVRGVVLIPGSGEFVYAKDAVARVAGGGFSVAENVSTRQGGSDWSVSLDQLDAALPNAESVSLIVSWFGTDLRAGVCEIVPAVDRADKTTTPITWSVAGVERGAARVVSQHEGRPAYGGTPDDSTVVAAIRDLDARGKRVTLTPFVLMDIPDGNTLVDPYTGGASQPAYPWRGRITVSPAAGQPGSPDKTAAAAAQIAAFLGTAAPGDFALAGDTVVYSGPAEWSYRRFVLHYAWLAKAAGNVDAFVIGTELRGLTQVRSSASAYPFVAGLVQLAADVKSVLGPGVKVAYAADWSEYFGHQPQDGTGDVHFHLDPLWASASIDAIGIDLYWPLADWREGREHLDYLAGARSTYDLGYLKGNIAAGEGYDWYYASAADRDAQVRTPITDGTGKPWVFRFKDIRNWWLSQHYDRPGGVEQATPTAWVPQAKPFWIMEIGCPAVDKGANQPNAFVDPKSSESTLPYFSRGVRDDLIQRRYLEAFHSAFDPDHAGYIAGANPVSSVYGARMLALDRIHVYAWDARPFPTFPADQEAWGDAANWRLGHWLNGRLASASLERLVSQLLTDFGFTDFDAGALTGTVPGFIVERIMSARDALQPLELAYFFDALESGAAIRFRHRGADAVVASLGDDDLVEAKPTAPLKTLTRGQETELPGTAKITHIAGGQDYRQAVAEARRLTGGSTRVAQAELPVVLEGFQAEAIAEAFLFEAWASRERAQLTLPPSLIALEPGDVVELDVDGAGRLYRITEIGERGAREIEALSIDPEVYGLSRTREREGRGGEGDFLGQPLAVFLDLPLLRGDEPAEAGYVAAIQTPWPGGVAFYRSPEATGYTLKAIATAPAVIGSTLDALPAGPEWRIDYAHTVRVLIEGGELTSVTRVQMLAGQNVAALETAPGMWEILQFETATLVAPRTYALSGLLRGQAGSEWAMAGVLPAGARFVLLDGAVARVGLTIDEVGLPYTWKVGPSRRAIGDPSYLTVAHSFRGEGLKPLSPAHVRGTRNGAGDLALTWLRRTRSGGDTWETADVPVAEGSERYEVDVLDGASVKRTIAVAAPAAGYTAAEQVADFGSVQSAVTVRVHQLSDVVGRGTGRTTVV
jgi:hypothetical protein